MNEFPHSFTSNHIVDHYDLHFDAGDKRNGSLYVCTPRGGAAPAATIASLRAAGLWSVEPEKMVADEQRQAYKDGLIFIEAAAYGVGDGHLLLARFDHPKFPSDAARWAEWLAVLDAEHERLR